MFRFLFSESDARCPIDNQKLSKHELFPDNYAKREILNLFVKCPNYKKGCDLVVTLSDVQVNKGNFLIIKVISSRLFMKV